MSILLAIQMFCGLFFVYPIGQFINVKTHEWVKDGTLEQRLSKYKYFVVIISVVGGLFGVLTNKASGNYSPYLLFSTLSIYVLSYTWYATFVPMLNMLGHRIYSAIIGSISLSIGLVLAITLTAHEGNALTWLLGQAAGFCVGGVWAKLCIRKANRPNNKSAGNLTFIDKKNLVRYSLPLGIGALLIWMQQTGYRFIIEQFWGLEKLAYLAIGLQIANQIGGAAEGLIMQFLYPKFFKICATNNELNKIENALSDLLNATVPLAILVAGLGIGGSASFLKILVAQEFRLDPLIICFGMVIEFCRMVTNVISNGAHVQTDASALRLPYLIGAVSTVVTVGIVGLLSKPIEWTIYGLTLTAILVLITMWICIYQKTKITLDRGMVYKSFAGSAFIVLVGKLLSDIRSVSDALICVAILLLLSMLAALKIMNENQAYHRLLKIELRSCE